MFEKEAEEYAQGMAMYYKSAHGSIPSQFEKYLRKAVEFGYNKANEWHFDEAPDNESPYRCPLCLVRPSLCTADAMTGKHTVGCLTSNCRAPIFTEPGTSSIRIRTKYIPLIEWDRWVVQYRNEHPNWHQEHVCEGCLKDWKTCGHYDANMVACPDAVCETEEEKE